MTDPNNRRISATPEADRFWELAIAVNAAFKGLLGSMGEIRSCLRARSASRRGCGSAARLASGPVATLAKLASPLVVSGDTVVIPDKIVAVAQGRIGPRRILREPDPKQIDS